LREAEEIAGGLGEEHLGRERQRPRWTGRVCVDAKEALVVCAEIRFQDGAE